MFETDERNKHYPNTGIMQSYSNRVEYKNLELEMSRKCPVSVKSNASDFQLFSINVSVSLAVETLGLLVGQYRTFYDFSALKC